MNEELLDRGVNNEELAKFQKDHLPEKGIQSQEDATRKRQLKLPLVWPGYLIAGISFIIELTVWTDLKYSPGGFLAVIYWLICVYRIHEVLIKEDNSYPITPSKAAWYHLIPFFNLYWIFKWPFELGKFVNQRKPPSERSPVLEMSGIFLLIGLVAGRFVSGTIAMVVVFTVGMYFNRKIASVVGLKKIEPIAEEKTYWV